ncbi:hypothetical protein KIPB_004716 [Kipferlia bialata]|uniref:Uncharacterized protein n=1 Tax=Kipferlia bialata TaxID=797122 RepID=A0A9K3CUX7_9EUKA|nr:hypothetical protein KIPB_004716 [Kipferlia bialata]|eukprot:g4716.t1
MGVRHLIYTLTRDSSTEGKLQTLEQFSQQARARGGANPVQMRAFLDTNNILLHRGFTPSHLRQSVFPSIKRSLIPWECVSSVIPDCFTFVDVEESSNYGAPKYRLMLNRRTKSVVASYRLTSLLKQPGPIYMGETNRDGSLRLCERKGNDFSQMVFCGSKNLSDSVLPYLSHLRDEEMAGHYEEGSVQQRSTALGRWARGRFSSEVAEVEADTHIAQAMASDPNTIVISNDSDMVLSRNSRVVRVDDMITAYATGTDPLVYTSKYLAHTVLKCPEHMLPVVSWACFNDETRNMRESLHAFWLAYAAAGGDSTVRVKEDKEKSAPKTKGKKAHSNKGKKKGSKKKGNKSEDVECVDPVTGLPEGTRGMGDVGEAFAFELEEGDWLGAGGRYAPQRGATPASWAVNARKGPKREGLELFYAEPRDKVWGEESCRHHRAVASWCKAHAKCLQKETLFTSVLARPQFESLREALVSAHLSLAYPLPSGLSLSPTGRDGTAATDPTPLSVGISTPDPLDYSDYGRTLSLHPIQTGSAHMWEYQRVAEAVGPVDGSQQRGRERVLIPDCSADHQAKADMLGQALAGTHLQSMHHGVGSPGFICAFQQGAHHTPQGYKGRRVPQYSLLKTLFNGLLRSVIAPPGPPGYLASMVPVPTRDIQDLPGTLPWPHLSIPFPLLQWRDVDLGAHEVTRGFSAMGIYLMDIPFRYRVPGALAAMQSGGDSMTVQASLFADIPGYQEAEKRVYPRAPVPGHLKSEPREHWSVDGVDLTVSLFTLVMHPFPAVHKGALQTVVEATYSYIRGLRDGVREEGQLSWVELRQGMTLRGAILTHAFMAHFLSAVGMPLSLLEHRFLALLLESYVSDSEDVIRSSYTPETEEEEVEEWEVTVAKIAREKDPSRWMWAQTQKFRTPKEAKAAWDRDIKTMKPAGPLPTLYRPYRGVRGCALEGTGAACMYNYLSETAMQMSRAHKYVGLVPGVRSFTLMDGERFLRTLAVARAETKWHPADHRERERERQRVSLSVRFRSLHPSSSVVSPTPSAGEGLSPLVQEAMALFPIPGERNVFL